MNKIKYWFSLVGGVHGFCKALNISRPTYYAWIRGNIPLCRVDKVVKDIDLPDVGRKEIIDECNRLKGLNHD